MMRAFVLIRDEDETGLSGTGRVVEGVEFSDGSVAMRWLTDPHSSIVIWDAASGMESVEAIHGHNGKTRIEYVSGDIE